LTIKLKGATGAKYSLCLMSLLVLSVKTDGAARAIMQIMAAGNNDPFKVFGCFP
jgi:hypothetical protein